MAPFEELWTGVGEGEGSLPWSSICFSPGEWDCVSNNCFWGISGEHPLCLCGGGREKQLSIYSSRKPTHAGIPKLDSHEEHPASSDLSTLRSISTDSLWSHVYCNIFALEYVMYYRNTAGVFSSEHSSYLANITTPGRLDRQWHMILLEKTPQTRTRGKIFSTSPIWWLQNAAMACTAKTHGREQPGLMALNLAVATCLRKLVQSCWYDTRV